MGIPFHNTGMGKKFIEHDFPHLIEVLAKIARSLESISEDIKRKNDCRLVKREE